LQFILRRLFSRSPRRGDYSDSFCNPSTSNPLSALLNPVKTKQICRVAAQFTLFLAVLGIATPRPIESALRGNLLAIYDLSIYRPPETSLASPVEGRLVAHAGGAVRGLTYTNSRDALDESYANGYRIFELDFDWTSDGRLVLVHDWNHTSMLFRTAPHVFSYREFVEGKPSDGLHQLTFEDLNDWLHRHPDALVVTDTKASNFRLLDYLSTYGRNILPQLIVQIYRLSELRTARQLGSRAVWLAIYKASYPAWALSRISGIDAFVIPVAAYPRYNQAGLIKNTRFYVHSVAANEIEETFKHCPGIYGIYVD
jgi:glycerophosphoryl diester phosphodiesterase